MRGFWEKRCFYIPSEKMSRELSTAKSVRRTCLTAATILWMLQLCNAHHRSSVTTMNSGCCCSRALKTSKMSWRRRSLSSWSSWRRWEKSSPLASKNFVEISQSLGRKFSVKPSGDNLEYSITARPANIITAYSTFFTDDPQTRHRAAATKRRDLKGIANWIENLQFPLCILHLDLEMKTFKKGFESLKNF